jgi:hydroxyethylthiazole kinase
MAVPQFDPAATLAVMQARRPLVHNITNFVAMTISANVLLAVGASPAMVHAAEEVEEFAGIADSLVINIGTLSAASVAGMKLAAATMQRLGKPWVLDPVACGATTFRRQTALDLLALKPTVIRGNAGEIMALAGACASGRKVDTGFRTTGCANEDPGAGSKGADSIVGSDAALDAARSLAQASGAVVAVTGEIDYVTDGETTVAISGGHPLMPLSTAIGCALSATVGAFIAVEAPLAATVAALASYAAAGKIAGLRSINGPGHFPAELCDALYRLTPEAIATESTVEVLA